MNSKNVLDEKLKELQFFEKNCTEHNWDSEGAYPLSHNIIVTARAIILKLAETNCDYDLVIHTHGTLGFEQESDDYLASLEIGIKKYSFYLKDKHDDSKTQYAQGLTHPINELMNVIDDLFIKPFLDNTQKVNLNKIKN